MNNEIKKIENADVNPGVSLRVTGLSNEINLFLPTNSWHDDKVTMLRMDFTHRLKGDRVQCISISLVGQL